MTKACCGSCGVILKYSIWEWDMATTAVRVLWHWSMTWLVSHAFIVPLVQWCVRPNHDHKRQIKGLALHIYSRWLVLHSMHAVCIMCWNDIFVYFCIRWWDYTSNIKAAWDYTKLRFLVFVAGQWSFIILKPIKCMMGMPVSSQYWCQNDNVQTVWQDAIDCLILWFCWYRKACLRSDPSSFIMLPSSVLGSAMSCRAMCISTQTPRKPCFCLRFWF